MGHAIGDVLPLAAAVALFPIPILVVILLLFSRRAPLNVPAFLVGWVGGLAIVVMIAALVTGGYESAVDDPGDHGVDLLRIGIGAVVLAFAIKKWLGRPTGEEDAEMPGWLSTIAAARPPMAMGYGVLLSALNPKNIAIAFAAGIAVGRPYLTTAESVAAASVFLVLASLGVLAPVLYFVAAGESAKAKLDQLRGWLVDNNAVVVSVLMALIGVVLIGEGLSGY